MKRTSVIFSLYLLAVLVFLFGVRCAKPPLKKYFTINYVPEPMAKRLRSTPYPYVIRVKEFRVEEAYARPQIVYRKSPFELSYYYFRVWAVKPARMITDMVHKHLNSVRLVEHVVRRLDEGFTPNYELSGTVEALEEYDSENIWFAHFAIRFKLVRLHDNMTIYTQRFDGRKRVFQYDPEYVVRELSQIMDIHMNQMMVEIDDILNRELEARDQIQQPKPSEPLELEEF